MKIAMMVRGFIPAPRPDDIVYVIIDLALTIGEGLIARGHQVDFYGPDGTYNSLPVKTRSLRSLVNSQGDLQHLLDSTDLLTYYVPGLWDHYLAQEMFERATAGKYDLIHFHHPESSISLAQFYPKVPVAYTLHDGLDGWHQEIFKMFPSANESFISISNNQRKAASSLQYAATVYNGIDPDDFPFSAETDDYLLFVGRIVPEKGLKEAVQIARKANERLVIIGPILPSQQKYFDKHVKPFLNDRIKYLGYIPNDKLAPYFQKAKALLSPIQWEEPFGVTMIEAMATGTPVIAFRRGSVPEIVIDKVTGFVVDTADQMMEAVKKLPSIDRRTVRKHMVAKFSVEKMVDGYEAAFQAIIDKANPPLKIKSLSKSAA